MAHIRFVLRVARFEVREVSGNRVFNLGIANLGSQVNALGLRLEVGGKKNKEFLLSDLNQAFVVPLTSNLKPL